MNPTVSTGTEIDWEAHLASPEQFHVHEYGVRMYPNPDYPDAPPRPWVSAHQNYWQAQHEADSMTLLALKAGAAYQVARAEIVTRLRSVRVSGAEFCTPWEVREPSQGPI